MVSFSPDGRRKDNRQMRWGRRNRTSLTVRYDTATGQVTMRRLFFKDALDVVPAVAWNAISPSRAQADACYERKYVLGAVAVHDSAPGP